MATCDDCRRNARCKREGAWNGLFAARMHNISFWDNAETACGEFEEQAERRVGETEGE